MRREHRGGFALERLELVQRVGVDDRRDVGLLEETADQRLRVLSSPEARPDRQRLRPLHSLEDLLERTLDRFEDECLENLQRVGRRSDCDVPRVGAKGGPRSQRSGSGHPP